MKNRKGFTLVELIAVIAVLAVVLLLIVPNVLEMFEDGKKDAFIRQIQSVWKEAEKEFAVDYANDIDNSVYSDSVSNLGKQLKLNKSKVTYVVGFDDYGQVNYIAVGDSKFCYISANPDDMAISREAVSEGTLTCSAAGCTCAGESSTVPEGGGSTPVITAKYKYWDFLIAYNNWVDYGSTTGAPRGIYPYSSLPTNSITNVSSLSGHMFIKTELSNSNEVVGHELCIRTSVDEYNCINYESFTNSSTTLDALYDFMSNFTREDTYKVVCNAYNDTDVYCRLERNYDGVNVNTLYKYENNSSVTKMISVAKESDILPTENNLSRVYIKSSKFYFSCGYSIRNELPSVSCSVSDDTYIEEIDTSIPVACGLYGEEVGCYSMDDNLLLK